MNVAQAASILQSVSGKPLSRARRQELAVLLAAELLTLAKKEASREERHKQQDLAALLDDANGKAFAVAMTDQCFRSRKNRRIADQLSFLLSRFGIPQFLRSFQRAGFWLMERLPLVAKAAAVPFIKKMIRKQTQGLIIPGEEGVFIKHVVKRSASGVTVNLNHLGEAILGEPEAERRLQVYLDDLKRKEIRYISVKISTICSQINPVAWDETVAILAERLRKLYRACLKEGKFVNLDMEEYRDLRLTVEVFKTVLDEPEFTALSAGVVLQSYLPDAYLVQQELTVWAMKRRAMGAAPIKIRLVKGANLGMEQVESSVRGWELATYADKTDVDANFKRMLEYGCHPQHVQAVHIGVGSHNLFDIAYALLLRAENGVEQHVSFEMLEGMAEAERRVVQQISKGMLLYCPVAKKQEFQNAVAYLIRRLDENTAPENFLRWAFQMEPGSDIWEKQVELFVAACQRIDTLPYNPKRVQNRAVDNRMMEEKRFCNEPDTDFSLPHNGRWIREYLRSWRLKAPPSIEVSVGGKRFSSGLKTASGEDPSSPGRSLYQYPLASIELIDQALEVGKEASKKWSGTSPQERAIYLQRVASYLHNYRGDLIGVMAADTGKTVLEADVELSEAVDFANFYAQDLLRLHAVKEISLHPKGVCLVAPPWNFPCSIPAGGILAALAMGNAVLFKPAPEAVYVGWVLAQVFWGAGIPEELLQFIPCDEAEAGTRLVEDPRLDVAILTGSTETARLFLNLHPGLDLMAETGGKNAIIVTALADRDLAARDIVQSAFGFSGQKCSACSLVICEEEVYNDPLFKRQLKEAAGSLPVGLPWDLMTKVNPLIRAPNEALFWALTELEPGEEWILEPKADPNNLQLWSPGIKWGVRPGSKTHQTEFFGPILGVMCAKNLDEAIQIANGTPYGLTSGLHSLDVREQEEWLSKIVAGNLYINRGITGAIVGRQPFGGCKASGFGPGAKAGGYNYLAQLSIISQSSLPAINGTVPEQVKELERLLESSGQMNRPLWECSVCDYADIYASYFSKKTPLAMLYGQNNELFYVPHADMCLRIQNEKELFDACRVLAASRICKVPLSVSIDPSVDYTVPHAQVEREEEWLQKSWQRVRLLSPPSKKAALALAKRGCSVIQQPVLASGRFELTTLLREVVVSYDYHRYGNITEKEFFLSEL